jgi:TolB-like protein/class 3 adenylate cyclase/Flp pilus assembly protein TadD
VLSDLSFVGRWNLQQVSFTHSAMGKKRNSRRLAAILAADVVGYSRMLARNEAGTLAALRQHRENIFEPAVARNGGRIFKLMGDGALAEFGSVVDAVNCALTIQRSGYSESQPDNFAITLRIGISLGDIIAEGTDIYGDGVNIAARLEPLADPGGICVASVVVENISGRIDAVFSDAGEVRVKNIDHPLHVWKWRPDKPVPGVAADSLVSSFPDKPSIAVLPFANLSGDAEQEYFADGITEDVITALSRIHWFFVIARNTTFTYKNRAVTVQEVARELSVRYVLEGSVRKSGNRLRITGQLIEGESGNHLWAEKYDRNLEDVFEVQDEITENIVGALEPQMAAAENIRSRRKAEQNVDAWDLVIRGLARVGEFSKEASKEALSLFDRAITIDPTYARAYSQKAWTLAWRLHQGWEDVESTLPNCQAAAEKAIHYDPEEPWAYIAWIFIATVTRDAEKMLSSAQKAIELNPNFAIAHSFLGAAYALTGRGPEAFEWIAKARRLSPRDIFREEFDVHSSFAYFQVADYAKAAEYAARAAMPRPEHVYPHLILAASCAFLGRSLSARSEVDAILRLSPAFSISVADKTCVFVAADDRARFLDGLKKAGVPE